MYSFWKGDPIKYLKGYDSWGNVCGQKENIPIPGVIFSEKEISANNHKFQMDLAEYENAIYPTKYFKMYTKQAVICVKDCPRNIANCKRLVEESGYTNIPQS